MINMKKIGFNEHYGLQTAVCNGTKTKTRRIEKCLDKLYAAEKELGEPLEIYQQEITREGIMLRTNAGIISLHTRYKIDEEVAVAQAYQTILDTVFGEDQQWKFGYMRDVEESHEKIWEEIKGRTNKMFVKADFMPNQIRITDIKVERLQDISDEDCLKEGIRKSMGGFCYEHHARHGFGYRFFSHIRDAFASLIDKPGVGGKGTWKRNPWVVVYSFKLIK